MGEDLPVTRSWFDIPALTAGITELRVAAETVRTAGIGLRCPDLSLFAITEQLWLFSARELSRWSVTCAPVINIIRS